MDAEGRDIEDLMGISTYVGLVNLCYKLPRRHRMSMLNPLQGQQRLVQQVEEHFSTVGLGLGAFDRYRVAEFLAENAKKCAKKLPDLSEAMDRFERVFAEIHALQSSGLDSVSPADTSRQQRRIGEITSTERASRSTQAEKV